MPSLNITADNLPKDSGNRFYAAPYDASASAYRLPQAYPVSGNFGGVGDGHIINVIQDLITSTGSISSGVDLGGWLNLGLYIPPMGAGTQLTFQASASGIGWTNITTNISAPIANFISASGTLATGYFLGMSTHMEAMRPMRYVRMSAANNQTATRTAVWLVMS